MKKSLDLLLKTFLGIKNSDREFLLNNEIRLARLRQLFNSVRTVARTHTPGMHGLFLNLNVYVFNLTNL